MSVKLTNLLPALQVKRKEALESQLSEIEKDIKTLQRGDTVVVVQD